MYCYNCLKSFTDSETKVFVAADSDDSVILAYAVLIQLHVTDTRTEGGTDRRTHLR